MTAPSTRVPAALQDRFNAIAQATDAFCDQRLNGDYKRLVRLALAALSRKRPSPLLKGKDSAWAAGAVHALGMVNFLFDPSQTPHCKASDIQAYFGVGASTCSSRSKEMRDALGMGQLSPEWTLPGRLDKNPLVWMLQVNGLLVDVRYMPLEVQEIAFAQGLIPYVPGRKADGACPCGLPGASQPCQSPPGQAGHDAGAADRATAPGLPPAISQGDFRMSKKTIRAALEQALLHGAALSAALCEEVLLGAADELEASLREDGDDALIAVVADGAEVAFLMIDKAGTHYRNEAARAQLQQMWRGHYATNVQTVLPLFVDDLSQGLLAVAGVQWVPAPAP